MDSSRWIKIKGLFAAAFDLPEHERPAFLDRCDADLRPEVERLLRADLDAGGFIVEPAIFDMGLAEGTSASVQIGTRIDSYIIMREIGHGGMGTVYLAERADASFNKQVALKLIKRGMDTGAVLKRFLMERQILAGLEHPNIAALLDGGSTADGLPYFVMEYIEGESITKFSDLQNLSTIERLELFQKVCSAISYAHQNLVVHRDIKPSNILVTADGVPKLLDFGIAKLLNPEWSLDTDEATATMFRIMTPEYASPEQIRGLSITTQSDVYSLGVVLYELLSGRRPYKIESRLPEEVAQIILTAEPLKPSDAVTQQHGDAQVSASPAAGRRLTTNGRVRALTRDRTTSHALKGDLDNIILKALRKEPSRRYATVQEFSEDIRRHLDGRPVTATADTSLYRLTKFYRRHRAAVFTSLVVALIFVSATAVTGWQSIVARRERDRAEHRFNQVRKLANTVLFEYHDGIAKLAGSTPMREKMVSDALEYLDNLSAESTDDIDLKRELAGAYEKIGDVQSGDDNFGTLNQSMDALLNYQKALKIREEIQAASPANADDDFALATCLGSVADLIGVRGDIAARNRDYQRALETFERLVKDDPSNQKFKNGLAGGYYDVGFAADQGSDNENAIANYTRAIAIWQDLILSDPSNAEISRKLTKAYKFLGKVYERGNDNADAIKNYDQAILLDQARVASDSSDAGAKLDLSASYLIFAGINLKTENIRSAEEFCQKGLEIRKEIVTADPENTDAIDFLARAYDTLGQIEQKKKNLKAAIENFQQAIIVFTGPKRADSFDFLSNNHLANFYNDLAAAFEEVSNGPVSGAIKRQNLIKAKENYEKTLEIVRNLQQHGTLTSRNLAKPDDILQKIKSCDAALEKTR